LDDDEDDHEDDSTTTNNDSSNNNNNQGDSGEDNSFTQRYTGHCNIRTVKEVNFYGPRSEYVVSGSDCGRVFIWDKKTAQLVNMMVGDRDVVNCASGHPFDPTLATSGIENNVKIWTPTAEKFADLKSAPSIMEQNYHNATEGRPVHGMSMSRLHALVRSLARRDAAAGSSGVVLMDGEDDDADGEEEGEEEEGRVRCRHQ